MYAYRRKNVGSVCWIFPYRSHQHPEFQVSIWWTLTILFLSQVHPFFGTVIRPVCNIPSVFSPSPFTRHHYPLHLNPREIKTTFLIAFSMLTWNTPLSHCYFPPTMFLYIHLTVSLGSLCTILITQTIKHLGIRIYYTWFLSSESSRITVNILGSNINPHNAYQTWTLSLQVYSHVFSVQGYSATLKLFNGILDFTLLKGI